MSNIRKNQRAALAVSPPYPIFTDVDGSPLENGFIYIGTVNLNPQSNPIDVFWDSNLTIQASQPIRTSGGYPVFNGTPARIYTSGNFSITTLNKNGSFIYTAASVEDFFGNLAAPMGSNLVGYQPIGVGAVDTTVQSKLRQIVSVRDRGAVADWNGATGTDNSAAFVAAITDATTNRKRLVVPAGRYSVGVSGISYSAAAINYLEIYFEAGVELICTYSGADYPFLLTLNGIGTGVKIVGNGAKLTYFNAPASRGDKHAVYLYGDNATITDLEVSGFVITNSPNFGVAVYAGPTGGASTGNKNVKIHDIKTINSKADGVHVENFDSGVDIWDINIDNPGDDSLCVSNYTGSSGAATKTTATNDVAIWNITGVNTYSALVRLLGVNRCSVSRLRGTLGTTFGEGAAALSCDNSDNADYNVSNTDITYYDVEVSGGANLFYYIGGGQLRNVKMRDLIQRQGKSRGILVIDPSATVGTKVSDIEVDTVLIERATNSGAATDWPVQALKVRGFKITNLQTVNAPSSVRIDSCDRPVVENITTISSGSTGAAFSFVNNTNIQLGRLVIDGSCTFTTGVEATGNTNVWHTALWDLTGATTKLSLASNVGVRGVCQRVERSVFLGSITGGTNAKQTYAENIITGTSYQLQATLISDQGTRWGVTGIAADGFFVLYTDTMTNARINYVAETNIGF